MKNNFLPYLFFAWIFLLPVNLFSAGREVKTFNEGWRFHQGDLPGASAVVFEDESWEKVLLPHTWNTDAYVQKEPYAGIGWYRKTFFLPEYWKGKQLFLKFEAASKAAVVYINGEQVGEHRGGYSAFTLDITSYCSYDQPNIMAVCVGNIP